VIALSTIRLQELLAELCRLSTLHQGEGGQLRAVQVLLPRLQGHLPRGVVQQVGRAKRKGNFPCKNLKRIEKVFLKARIDFCFSLTVFKCVSLVNNTHSNTRP